MAPGRWNAAAKARIGPTQRRQCAEYFRREFARRQHTIVKAAQVDDGLKSQRTKVGMNAALHRQGGLYSAIPCRRGERGNPVLDAERTSRPTLVLGAAGGSVTTTLTVLPDESRRRNGPRVVTSATPIQPPVVRDVHRSGARLSTYAAQSRKGAIVRAAPAQ